MAKSKTFSIYHPLVRLVGGYVHRLEYDPVTQFKFNFFFTWLWVAVMVGFPFIPMLYGHNLGILIVQELSIWALFISHFTAVGSAIAGIFAANREDEVPSLKAYKTRIVGVKTFDSEQTPNQDVIDAIHNETVAERKTPANDASEPFNS